MNALSQVAVAASDGFAHHSVAQRIVFKRGSRLGAGDELRALGCARAVFVAGPNANAHPGALGIRSAIRPLLADEFLEVDRKLPTALIAALASRADAASADAIVAFGGGACIDIAKAGARAIGQARGGVSPAVLAIPSTLVGAELSPVPGGAARVALYDPDVLGDVDAGAVLASGAAAVSHAVEALYARGDALVETVAVEALRRLAPALPRFRDNARDTEAASELFHGAYLAGFAMGRAPMGLAHGICRTLSARTGIPYSTAHAIVLPHAMRYNRSAAPDRLAVAGRALRAAYQSEPDDVAAHKAAAAVERLVRALGLPARLRDVGLEEGALLPLAEAALANPCMAFNPRPIESAGQILSVLRSAY